MHLPAPPSHHLVAGSTNSTGHSLPADKPCLRIGYTQAGPGALRGLKKAFVSLGDYSPADAILWMTERQQLEFKALDLPFNGLFGRPLHAIDCQGLFCELDKYCREAAPELVSNRSRIKARFSASSEPLQLFFPPKWGLKPLAATIQTSQRSASPTERKSDQYELLLQFEGVHA